MQEVLLTIAAVIGIVIFMIMAVCTVVVCKIIANKHNEAKQQTDAKHCYVDKHDQL